MAQKKDFCPVEGKVFSGEPEKAIGRNSDTDSYLSIDASNRRGSSWVTPSGMM